MKKILNISVVVILLLAVAGMAGYFWWQFRNRKVSDVRITLFRPDPHNGFLNKDILYKTVNPDSFLFQKKIKDVNIGRLQRAVENNPFVENADLFFTLDGTLEVHVKERIPLVRIYTYKGKTFYIDKNGVLFPVGNHYTPHVIIANGFITRAKYRPLFSVNDSLMKNSLLPDIYRLAKTVSSDPFLNALVSQIYVNSKKQFDLIPEIGNQVIRFGTIENREIKLENLKAFYRQVYVKQGGNRYSQINLQYINQIVCTKK